MPRKLSSKEIQNAVKKISYLGYAIIPGYLSKLLIEKLLSKIISLHAMTKTIGLKSSVTENQLNDKYIYNLQHKDLDFLNIISESNILNILLPYLNDPFYRQLPKNAPNFLLAYYNARSSVDRLPLHIDNYVPSSGTYPISMQIAFSLNGQNFRNGATVVVPGSHRIENYADREVEGIQQVLECNSGDAIIWDSRLWHGALKNVSNTDRWSLVATFRPWWAKQNYDPISGVSDELFQKLTKKQKSLLGFLSIPPKDEFERVVLKQGYGDLLESISEYKARYDERC